MTQPADYDFFISILNFLDFNYQLNLRVGSNDFDLIYSCWEKVIYKAINKVVERRKATKKTVKSFSDFHYQIKREFKNYLESNLGTHDSEEEAELDCWQISRSLFQERGGDLLEIFTAIKSSYENNEQESLKKSLLELLKRFENNQELLLKTELFKRNLSSMMKSEKVIRRFQLSFIINYFKIPVELSSLDI